MHAKYNYLASTNTTTGISFSGAQLLSDLVALLSGVTDKTQLTGKVLLCPGAASGITATSITVTWAGANTDINIAVGQPVSGPGVPAGATVATITDRVGFTLSVAATVTNAAAVLALGYTTTLPPSTIGSTTVALSLTNASAVVAWAGANAQTVVPGMLVTGYGIPASTKVNSVSAGVSFTMSNAATATVANTAAIVLTPAASAGVAGPVCDTANSYIFSGYTAGGWTLCDQYANAGKSDRVVLRAPLADDTTQFKYIGLSILAAEVVAAGGVALFLYESWDAVNHAAVNQATGYAANGHQRTTTTVAASMLINASARHCLMKSTIAAGQGNVGNTVTNCWTGVFERTRSAPWDTTAAGYPPVIWMSGGIFGTGSGTSVNLTGPCFSRLPNPAGGDLAPADCSPGNIATCAIPSICTLGWHSLGTVSATMGIGGIPTQSAISNGAGGTVTIKVPDGAGGFYTPLTDFHVMAVKAGWQGGSISQASDVWVGPAYAQNLDEVDYAGKTYVLIMNANAAAHATLAIPKG